jgi:hypothetical protein
VSTRIISLGRNYIRFGKPLSRAGRVGKKRQDKTKGIAVQEDGVKYPYIELGKYNFLSAKNHGSSPRGVPCNP